MRPNNLLRVLNCVCLLVGMSLAATGSLRAEQQEKTRGWLNWRGPLQTGVSLEKGLPETWALGGENDLWSVKLSGRGTPVVAGNRVYAWGYRGEKADLQEVLACLDLETGKTIWEKTFNDFLSDNIYNRYSIGSPAIDPETGNVHLMTSPGLLVALDADGEPLWERSMMEELGQLTFPNGRTGAPVIDGDLVIVHGITTNWGAEGPARDRFYAFDKLTGDLVWSSTPGVGPQDSSNSTLVLEWRDGRRVFYAGTGCGNVVCVNARNGKPLWRFQLSRGGVNSSVVLKGDRLIAIHDKENIDNSETGRMVAIPLNGEAKPSQEGAPLLAPEAEIWRNHLSMFSSSPVLAGDRVYQVVATGELCAVDVNDGKVLWEHKFGTSQLHASPLWGDDKLYVPMEDGHFFILRPSDAGVEILADVALEGNCLGAPAAWNGKLLVHTTEKLYCFGRKGSGGSDEAGAPAVAEAPKAGEAAALQAIPAEVLLRPGQKQAVRVRALDGNGLLVGEAQDVKWEKFIPPTAKVRSEMDAEFNAAGELAAGEEAKISAGAFKATAGAISGTIRGRILSNLPMTEDFEGFELTEQAPGVEGKFAYPPLPWIGARFKWEVRENSGSKVLAKTLDRILFQRSTIFLGHPEMRNYTAQVDVMTDGERRGRAWVMSDGGVVNQRYLIALKGSWQQIEVSSNHERIKEAVPFKWEPGKWYRLKTRVDVAADGSGVVRAKAWPRDGAEPEGWLIEVKHRHAHAQGSPGLFGFSPQSQFRVYLDNAVITPNE